MLSTLEKIDRKIKKIEKWFPEDQEEVIIEGTPAESDEWREYIFEPVRFVDEIVLINSDEELADYQKQALNKLVTEKRISLRGPHGLGKTTLMALAVLWFACTRPEDTKIPTTASAWRQLEKYLWPEIRKWARIADWDKWLDMGGIPPNILMLTLRVGMSCEAFALASDNAAFIEGAHAANLLYVFDESKTIPDSTWDATEGAFASGDAYFISCSTPGPPIGRFYEIQRRAPGYEDWWVRHVRLEEAIEAGRINEEWALQRKTQWGENSAVYQNRVLGEFASSEEDSIIPLAHVEAANERWLRWIEDGKPGDFKCVSVDVGRGGDPSVYGLRFDHITDEIDLRVIAEIRKDNKRDTMSVAGKTAGILNKYNGYAIIDVIGVGAGVVDRLRELIKPKDKETDPDVSYTIKAFSASEKTNMRDKSGELGFVNKRAAAWWNVRELLEDNLLALPLDDKLTGDLTAPHWREASGGRIQVEDKEKIKKRLGRSTDDGDTVVMAFYEGALSPSQMIDFA